MKMCNFYRKVAHSLHTYYILIADFNRYMTYFTYFLLKVYKNIIKINSSTCKYSNNDVCGCKHAGKVCKACIASIKACNNYVIKSVQYVCFTKIFKNRRKKGSVEFTGRLEKVSNSGRKRL